jgi:Predicted AAA-ATPase
MPNTYLCSMKNLPIGIQTLVQIRAKNCIYVDKTRLVHQLATTGTYYFFSRPRTAQEGMDQIKKQDYAGKYRASDKVITGIGVNFSTDKKGIDDWMEEVL